MALHISGISMLLIQKLCEKSFKKSVSFLWSILNHAQNKLIDVTKIDFVVSLISNISNSVNRSI